MAESEAFEAVAKITQDTPAARMELSKQMHELIGGVQETARKAEHELWEAIPGDIRVKADDVVEEHAFLLKELAATGEDLPAPLKFFVDKINAPGSDGTVSMGDIIAFRKRALQLARDAAPTNKSEARMYGRMAESVMDSLDTTFGAADSPVNGLNRALGLSADTYNTARAYSREFNNAFTRTFAGQALEKSRKGTSRVPAELMAAKAFATGGDAAALRLDELEVATRFITNQGLEGVTDVADATEVMLGFQQRLLRLAAAESIETTGERAGRVTARKLGDFIKNNAALMERFPAIKKDLMG